MAGGTVVNTLVTGHEATNGGGVYKTNGTLLNCTIAGNTAINNAPGVYQTGGSMINTAVSSLQSLDAVFVSGGSVSHSCGTGLTTDANGNFGDSPYFRDEEHGDYTLQGSSPCVDGGEQRVWHADAKDISGINARIIDGNNDGIAGVDIGAFEYDPSKAPLGLSFSALASPGDTLPKSVTYNPCIEGSYGTVERAIWDFGDGTVITNASLVSVQHNYNETSYFTVTLKVNTTGAGELTCTVVDAVKIRPTTVYMSTTGSKTPPYNTLEKATDNIADAIYALKIPESGRAKVIIADGTYSAPVNRQILAQPIEIVGNDANPSAVTFDGESKRAFFYLNNTDAFVHGIRFYRGLSPNINKSDSDSASFSGSHLELRYGVLSNCVVEACSGGYCGGVSVQKADAKVYDLVITGISSTDTGMAAYGGGLRLYNGYAENCIITNCSCTRGAGAYVAAGTMRNCRIMNNSSTGVPGGGLYIAGGIVENCVIVSNKTANGGTGGGVYSSGGTLRNSLIAWNTAKNGTGGGAYMTSGNIQNCSFYGNKGESLCDGVWMSGGTLVNTAVSGTLDPVVTTGGIINNSCSLALTTGVDGNIASEPGFRDAAAGDFTLAGSSPCIDAGSELAWHANAKDLSGVTDRVIQGKSTGELRADIGAYEYDPSTAPVSLSFAVTGGSSVVLPHDATFTPTIEGDCGTVEAFQWNFGDGTTVSSGSFGAITHTYEDVGNFTVSLEIQTSLRGRLDCSVPGAVKIKPTTVYVSTTGNHVAPFHTSANAATNLLDALAELGLPPDGSRAKVIFADGTYLAPKDRVTLASPIEFIGNDVNPNAVTFDGGDARCFFYLDYPDAFIHGIRLYRGRDNSGPSETASGAGSYSYAPFEIRQGTASNCVFQSISGRFSCVSAWNTGKIFDSSFIGNNNRDSNAALAGQGGALKIFGSALCSGCLFTNNNAKCGGAIAIHGGTVENCIFTGNYARGGNGGAIHQTTGTLRGALVVANSANGTAGGLNQTGGTAANVTIADNTATASEGAIIGGTLANSIVLGKGEYDSSNPPLTGSGTITHCCSPSLTAAQGISADPRFMHADRGDYSIRPSSKCRGAGDNAYWPGLESAVDLTGGKRLKGARIDIGAYEADGGGMTFILR